MLRLPPSLRRPKRLASLLLASSVALLAAKSSAQEVFSQIVGATAFDLPAETDVTLAANFMPPPLFRGPVDGTAEAVEGGSRAPLPADSLEDGAFAPSNGVPTHYLYVETGALEGRRFDILGNDASSVTVDAADLGALAVDDEVSARPHRTLDEVFPEGVAFHEEESPGLREIELILPFRANAGVGVTVDRVFFFYDGAWREVGEPLDEDKGSTVIPPSHAIVIRNNGAAKTGHFFGEVADTPIAVPLETDPDEPVDNFVGVERPLPIAVEDFGLSGSVFAETVSLDDIQDQLLVFDPEAPGKNKQPVAAYFFYSGAWRKVGEDPSEDFGQDLVDPGYGLLIRKAPDPDEEALFWVNQWDLP